MSDENRTPSFTARGGWWVALQIPVLIAAVALPIATGRGTLWPPHGWQWFGIALAALGLAITVAGLVTLGRALTPFPRPRPDGALRTHGVYGLVRHPIYSGLIIATFGWSVWWLSAVGAAYTLLVLVFFDRKSAREERWLSERYPDYAQYRARVCKLIPGIY